MTTPVQLFFTFYVINKEETFFSILYIIALRNAFTTCIGWLCGDSSAKKLVDTSH